MDSSEPCVASPHTLQPALNGSSAFTFVLPPACDHHHLGLCNGVNIQETAHTNTIPQSSTLSGNSNIETFNPHVHLHFPNHKSEAHPNNTPKMLHPVNRVRTNSPL